MKVLVEKSGKLTFETTALSPLKGGEIRVRVKAIGVNQADLLQRAGKYPPPPGASEVLGLEIAGEIEELGPHTHAYHKGDRVMCLLSGGGYAEMVNVPETHCIPIPHNLSFEEGAAIPEAFLTAYQAVYLIGDLKPESTILIHAAAGGVGTAAIQLAKQFDAKVIATTRSKEKVEPCLKLGADAIIHAKEGKFATKVMEFTEGHGADLILDFIGASYFNENMEALSMGGAIIILSTLGGNTHEKFDLRTVIKKWATITGTTLRNRPFEYKNQLIEQFSRFALSRLESGKIRPIIDRVLSWEDAEKAHSVLKQNRTIGKIVLSL